MGVVRGAWDLCAGIFVFVILWEEKSRAVAAWSNHRGGSLFEVGSVADACGVCGVEGLGGFLVGLILVLICVRFEMLLLDFSRVFGYHTQEDDGKVGKHAVHDV